MDQLLYDVYFTGKLVEGADPQAARESFAKLFKAGPEAVDRFFNGNPQVLKRGVEKAEALKYKAALHKAGMMVAFKAHQEAGSEGQPAAQQPVEQAATAAPPETSQTQSSGDDGDWSLAPVGSDVLKPDERREVPDADIDTSAIKLESAFSAVEPAPREEPPAPDTSHISVAGVGADILVDKPEAPPPPALNLDAISLAPPGSELEELREQLTPVNPDISDITMAEVGADILEGQEKAPPPPAPNTDHLEVVDESTE